MGVRGLSKTRVTERSNTVVAESLDTETSCPTCRAAGPLGVGVRNQTSVDNFCDPNLTLQQTNLGKSFLRFSLN